MKKSALTCIISIILVVALSLSATAVTLGDMDGDGKVTSADARIVLRIAVGLDAPAKNICEHKYEIIAVEKAATCQSTGIAVMICSYCTNTYKTSIPVADHMWLNATCTAPKTCFICGLTSGEATAHTLKDHACINCNYVEEYNGPVELKLLESQSLPFTASEHITITKISITRIPYTGTWHNQPQKYKYVVKAEGKMSDNIVNQIYFNRFLITYVSDTNSDNRYYPLKTEELPGDNISCTVSIDQNNNFTYYCEQYNILAAYDEFFIKVS